MNVSRFGGVAKLIAMVAAGVAVMTFASCGGVRSAGLPGTPSEVFLVEVTDVVPAEPVRLVSVSTLDVIYEGEPLAPRPSDGDVEAMRRAAAGHGAELLVLERVDNSYRHAYYGFGYVRDRSVESPGKVPPPTCVHPDAHVGRDAAAKRAAACLGKLKAKRPALAGRLEMVFQVDAHGAIYRAAATPSSSRDTQVQRCGMKAVFAGSYGPHSQLLCTVEIAATL